MLCSEALCVSSTLCYTTHIHVALRVVFDGGPDGELWYQLQLSADDPSPVSLPDIECELGR